MKNALTLLFLVLLTSLSAQKVKSFGDQITEDEAITTNQLLVKLEDKGSLENTKVKGVLNNSCAVKGCWMTMRLPNGDEMRVSFKDYGFFVPKEGLSDKTAVVQGLAKRSETDVETLRHFAEDAGESAEDIAKITEPVSEVTFVASGVLIYE